MTIFVVDDMLFQASLYKPTILRATMALMPESTIQNIRGDIYLWPNVRWRMKHPRYVIGVICEVDDLHARRVEQIYGYIPYDFDNSRRIPVLVNVKRLYAKDFATFQANHWTTSKKTESVMAYVGNPMHHGLQVIEKDIKRRVTYPLSKRLFTWLKNNNEPNVWEENIHGMERRK